MLCSLIFTMSAFAQGDIISVKVSGNIFNTEEDSVYIAQFFNTYYENYKGAKLDEQGNFLIEASLPYQDFYVLRLGEERINLILRDDSDIKIYADGKNINAFGNIVGSQESANMKDFIIALQVWNMTKDETLKEMQANPAREQELKQKLDKDYAIFVSNRRSYIAQNPNSPVLLPALTTIDPNTDWATYEMVAKQLKGSLPGSSTIENAYKQYLALKEQKEAMQFLAPGKPAPDFAEVNPEGDTLKLSDLRGQIVLLDFWASWCGPCRRENPNVVALYEKYKDQGFTVMSVSLDQNRQKWLAAIQKDKLAWPYHVSDLKGWSSQAAKKYQVRGIPFTVLIDKEGNIIGTKLRGAALEAELARLFE